MRVTEPAGHLSSLNGEGTRSEALAWLAGRLRWEEQLVRLEQRDAAARPADEPGSARMESTDAA